MECLEDLEDLEFLDELLALADDDVGPLAVTPIRALGVTDAGSAPALGAMSTVGTSSEPAARIATGTVCRRCCTRMSPKSAWTTR